MSRVDEVPKVRCNLRIEFSDEQKALRVHRSIELDNQGYLTSRVEGAAILAEIEAASLGSLLHTIDDLMACTSLAENVGSRKR